MRGFRHQCGGPDTFWWVGSWHDLSGPSIACPGLLGGVRGSGQGVGGDGPEPGVWTRSGGWGHGITCPDPRLLVRACWVVSEVRVKVSVVKARTRGCGHHRVGEVMACLVRAYRLMSGPPRTRPGPRDLSALCGLSGSPRCCPGPRDAVRVPAMLSGSPRSCPEPAILSGPPRDLGRGVGDVWRRALGAGEAGWCLRFGQASECWWGRTAGVRPRSATHSTLR